jgi:putative peptidoglycan lipid II flippase
VSHLEAQDSPVTPSERSRQRHIARNVLLVSGAFALAAAVGLIRNAIIARQFGIGAALDAYTAAFKLPDLLFTIVAGGALATAFIPVFTGLLALNDREGAWRLASAITNWVTLITGGLALVVAIAAPWLVRVVIAPGFDAAQTAETVAVMRVVLISTVIFGISSLQGSVLHGFKHFLLPALAPVAYSLGIIAGALWLAPRWGILGLAVGAVIGAILHLAIKIPGLIRFGFRWWPILHAREGSVRRVVVLMIPRVLDLGVFHVTLLATTNLASRLGAGSVSALEWGWDAMQLPETIIGTAFGLVAFPTLAELAARGDRDGLRDTLTESLRSVLSLAVPAAVGLILLGRPLLALLYQRGAFDAQATEAVYVALFFYALGLVAHSCLELAARTFFAQQDTVTPLLLAIASATLNIGLGVILMGPLGYGGLALANSLAVTAEVLALLAVLNRRLRGIHGRELAGLLLRVVLASLIMGGAIVLVIAFGARAGWSRLVIVAAGGAIGLIVYLGACQALRVRELRRFARAIVG